MERTAGDGLDDEPPDRNVSGVGAVRDGLLDRHDGFRMPIVGHVITAKRSAEDER
jgi:hypothetical protein